MNSVELELVEFIRKRSRAKGELVVGVGDDCAVWRVPKGYEQVASLDQLIEGVHFDLSFTSVRDVACRTVARGLSDLAACGAEPKFCLLGLGLPRKVEIEQAEDFISELIKQLKRYGAQLVGGDVTEASRWTIGITSIGLQKRGSALKRFGASPNETVCLTGLVGLAAAGLEILKNRPNLVAEFPRLTRAYLKPKPRVSLGIFLATRSIASAAIDVSDGLLLDAWRLAEASGVSIVIEKKRLPLSRSLRAFCELAGKKPDDFMSAGDDYELLFTVPRNRMKRLSEAKERIYEIGYTKEGKGVYIADETGRLTEAPKKGYVHFKKPTRP